jgi:hypothetical protein
MRTNKTFEDENLDLSQLWKRLDRTPPGAIISRSNGKIKEVKRAPTSGTPSRPK